MKILIIEDNKTLSLLMKDEFEEQGFDVDCVDTLQNILEVINKAKPDIIILDIYFERVAGEKKQTSGLNVLRSLKKKHKTNNIYIIVNTAFIDNLAEIEALADRCFVKPNLPSDLIEAVKAVDTKRRI